eukprot:Phypoly_transcript_21864.p1 GENE.Phypoly_transcript_21864~~Phypoly_transcript_21864.p1  ORF type:complete len:161 (+),score=34.00 Phypoly_transcript_21864:95-577(+)
MEIDTNAPEVVLKSVFSKYDRDESGSINASELKNLCYDLGYYLEEVEALEILRGLDKDKGGSIDFKEFVAFWKDNEKFSKIDANIERTKQAATYFRWFDKDFSGSISADEYAQLHADLVKNKLIPANITAAQGLAQLDTTGDKKVSFNEFIAYLDKVQTQ